MNRTMKKKIIRTIMMSAVILMFCIQVNAQWELLDQILPDAMTLNTAITYEGKIYVIGGLNNPEVGSIATNKVRVFDTDQEIWLPDATDFPLPVCGATSGVIDNKIYVIGGAPSNWSLSNSLYEYSPTGGGSWVKKAEMLTSRFFHTSVILDDKIYVMGGRHIQDISFPVEKSVEMYDPNLNTWTQVADMNAPRAIYSAEVVNGKIYVMGGAQSTDSTNHTMEVYDPQSNTWTVLGDLPSERVFHGSAVFDNTIYVFGGHTENYERKTWKSDNLETGTWIELENTSIPETIGWFADATVDGSGLTCIYALGGGYANFYFYIIDNTLPPPYVTNSIYKLCFPTIVSTKNPGKTPGELAEIQIYPNPFSSTTNIEYKLEKASKINIQIFNLSGHHVATLLDEFQPQGEHEIIWDAGGVNSGIYIFKLQTDRHIGFKKGILIN
jgi:N-acetylneuraminic acid mutarotase